MSMISWHCHALVHGMPQGSVAGGIAVVIDVLRASTTIATALAAGAVAVIPTPTIDGARAARDRAPPGTLLGGERGGLPPAGFDLGNSPLDYTAARVAGRAIVVTTTNGTAALAACAAAAGVVVGALVNRTAVARFVRRQAIERGIHAVHLVCAGTDGAVSEEDLLGAGAILDAAAPDGPDDRLDPPAVAARDAFRRVVSAGGAEDRLVAAFRQAAGGRNLLALGMDRDLSLAARIDTLAVVPVLESGRLVAAPP
ncbi:MAG: 2-phosphosulfolactate phosphatase [Pirellulales bacterium]